MKTTRTSKRPHKKKAKRSARKAPKKATGKVNKKVAGKKAAGDPALKTKAPKPSNATKKATKKAGDTKKTGAPATGADPNRSRGRGEELLRKSFDLEGTVNPEGFFTPVDTTFVLNGHALGAFLLRNQTPLSRVADKAGYKNATRLSHIIKCKAYPIGGASARRIAEAMAKLGLTISFPGASPILSDDERAAIHQAAKDEISSRKEMGRFTTKYQGGGFRAGDELPDGSKVDRDIKPGEGDGEGSGGDGSTRKKASRKPGKKAARKNPDGSGASKTPRAKAPGKTKGKTGVKEKRVRSPRPVGVQVREENLNPGANASTFGTGEGGTSLVDDSGSVKASEQQSEGAESLAGSAA